MNSVRCYIYLYIPYAYYIVIHITCDIGVLLVYQDILTVTSWQ